MNCKSKCMFAMFLYVGCAITALPVVGQKPTPALVVNSTAQPVPTVSQGTTNVDGTVNIGNTPNVTVANTPSVNITNTPSVSITGTPTVALVPGGSTNVTNPLDGQNIPTPLAVLEAIQPYEDGCGLTISSGNNVGSCNFVQIPAAKRLVVEEFDANGLMDPGLKPVDLTLAVSAVVSHFFPATFMGSQPGGQDFFATHQATKLYSPAGFQPTCRATLTANVVNGGSYYCRISGFLVDTQ